MRVFKIAWLDRYAKKQRISDEMLINAIQEAESGNINANLGGGVIKQRIARQGQGKSSGYRTIIYYRQGERAFFAYAFSKSDRDNITPKELTAFKQTAQRYLSLTDEQTEKLLLAKEIIEIDYDDL